MVIPQPEYIDQYPYEKLTSKHTAEIARIQDRQIAELKNSNNLLKNELYAANIWRQKATKLLEANGINNISEAMQIMDDTDKVFRERNQ